MVCREYECPKCGRFEIRQNITEDALTSCPTCNKSIRQIFYPAEVRWLGRFRWMKFNPEVKESETEYGQFA